MGDRIGIARFDSGRGNTMRIVFPEVMKPNKCVVVFDADNGDIKKGKFGFDKLTDKLLGICDSDKEKLKNEYDFFKVDGEDYFPPWVSMRKGQTITLKVKSKFKNKDEYQSVTIEHPDFTFEPTDLKEASEIKITCNNTNPSTAQVKVNADGNDAGAINFFYPEPKTVNLRWVFVEINGDKKDNDVLSKIIKRSKLENYFKEALNPSLIDIVIQNEIAAISDISSQKDALKSGGYLKYDKEAKNYIEYSKKGAVLSLGSGSPRDTGKINDGINAYFFNYKCLNSINLSEGGAYDMPAGLSPTGEGDAYLVLDDNERIKQGNISHEVMHAIGLPHTFKEGAIKDKDKPFTCKETRTNNYMDYKNSKEHTYKYQWVKLYNSSFSN